MNNWQIKYINECESTNTLLKEQKKKELVNDKTAIVAGFQSIGRGQDKNIWHSEEGKNLLCSLYLKLNIKADKHFLITIAASLAIYELLSNHGIEGSIKWPNDIYVNNKKIAGILIENSLMGDNISDTIIGIGLNVNQTNFPDWIPNPVSMALLKSEQFETKHILNMLLEKMETTFDILKKNSVDELYYRYIKLLYEYNCWRIFEAKGHSFNGQIKGVMPDGRLLIETEGGDLMDFLFGEVKFENLPDSRRV